MDDFEIKKLEDYTNEEKIKFFDNMYANVLSELKEAEDGDYEEENEDELQYLWEEIMGLLAGEDKQAFWRYFNSLI